MSDKKLRIYEMLWKFVLLLVVIFGIVSSLTGCGAYFKIETANVIDYRFTEAHEEERIEYLKEYDMFSETEVDKPYKYKTFVPAKHELLWEYTYQDGHTERRWKECTRFEYENAQKELE